jgi:hypothetical protein
MLDQRRLDLERTDPVARGDDQVVGAADEAEVPVCVLDDLVARAPWFTQCRRRVAEVSGEESRHRRWVDNEFSVVDPQSDAGQWSTHRRGFHGFTHPSSGQLAGFSLAVSVDDLESGRLAPRPERLRV